MLDAKEYLHLAVNAINQEDHHAALSYLKEVLALEPDNANAIYLLAAEHAELGLFERAITGIKQALEIEPHIDIARFQLGLLYLHINAPAKAVEAFTFLSNNTSPTGALSAYAQGMKELCSDNILTACEKLALGLSRENDNPALKKNMQSVLNNLLDNTKSSTTDTENTNLYLGAYNSKIDTDTL